MGHSDRSPLVLFEYRRDKAAEVPGEDPAQETLRTHVNQTDLGKSVCGPSEQLIGHVDDVEGTGFRVVTENGRSYWLRQDCVFTVEEHCVTLICERENLIRYLLEG